jgi:NAD(P)H-hydrate epimerase
LRALVFISVATQNAAPGVSPADVLFPVVLLLGALFLLIVATVWLGRKMRRNLADAERPQAAAAAFSLNQNRFFDGSSDESMKPNLPPVAGSAERMFPSSEPVREPPADPLERHRWTVALENQGAEEAARVWRALQKTFGASCEPAVADAGEPGLRETERVLREASVWVFAGPGPEGAAALIAARRLESLGVRCAVRLTVRKEKMGTLAERECRTLEAGGFTLFESVKRKPGEALCVLLLGGVQTGLSAEQSESVRAAEAEAQRHGAGIVRTADFDPNFPPSPPAFDEVVFPPPPAALTQEIVRLMDAVAQSDFFISGAALMENAGAFAAREALRELLAVHPNNDDEEAGVTVLCGPGNNGGDGFVVARHLHNWGVKPRVFLLGLKSRLTGDAELNLRLLEEQGVKVQPLFDASQWSLLEEALASSRLAVDGLLGTGLNGPVRGAAAEAIPRLNVARKNGLRVLALDCPSGLHCNSGDILGVAVEADVTVTFAAVKIGLQKGRGPELCGRLLTADIGFPEELYRRFQAL